MKQGLEANSSLSHYRIVSQLGAGGMGEVWLAEDTRLDRKVALKLLPAEFTQDAERVRRFTQEAKAASALNHPNIVTVYDVGESESGRFIVMELVAGRTLRTFISAANSVETLLALGTEIAKALSAAHAAGITHRDLKPDNIMVRDDGYVKVLDFGLARLRIETETDPEAPTLARQTMPGRLLGTAAYMSPEQASGLSASYPADIFSLGIVFYELATGQHPFQSETLLGYLHAISFQNPAPLNRLNREIPAALNDLILWMLQKEPTRRPTAEEVVRTLQELARQGGGQGLSTHSSFVVPKRRNTVGREVERNELRTCFNRVIAGPGALLCVVGEPGIGKTTLVEDFLAELAAANQCIIARGRCSERLAGAEAYLPWLEALESLLHSGTLVQVMKHLAPTWYAQLVPLSGTSEESMRLLEEVKAASQERMKRELASLLQAAAESRPLVLFFDDLHWADVSTVDLLNFLGGKLDSLKVLIVTTYRPSDMLLNKHPFLRVKPDLQARGLCRELFLEFLTESEIGEYLALEFPAHRFPAELPKLIHAKTEGSPLFMADVVRYLRERGVIANTDGAWTLAQTLPDVERELPESVRGMIERKIAQLSEEDRKLLTAASVQGYEFDSAVAAQVVGLDADEVEERLEKLERVFAFVKLASEAEFPDRTLTLKYRFVHVLYQNSLYNSLRATRKATLSRSVAQTLENFYGKKKSEIATNLALLWESAREHERAADYFLQAARNAARIYADAETTALAHRGLANVNRLPKSSERSRMELRLQITLGAALMTNTYASSAVKQVYLRSEELCKELVDDRQLFRVQFGLSIICAVRGEYARALSLAEECLRLAERMNDEDLMAQAYWACGLSLQYPGEYAACLTHLEKAVAMGGLMQDPPSVSLQKKIAAVFSQGHLAVVLLYMGWPDKAETVKQNILTRKSAVTHPLSHADNLYLAAFVEVFHNRIVEVKRLSEIILQYAREQGLKWYIAVGQMLRGWATAKAGSVEDGFAQFRQGVSAYRATETELSLTFFLALFADALAGAGLFEQAADSLTEALALAERTGERYYESELHRLKGELILKTHDGNSSSLSAHAEAAFQSAIQISRRQTAKSLELRATVSLARLWERQGKSAQARRMLVEIYGQFTEGFDTPDLRNAKALLDELESRVGAEISASRC